MDIKNIINKKALKHALTNEEIEFFVNGYTNGSIPDYQASALLMAIKINGMTREETFALTKAMLYSGDVLDLSDIGFCVDKHSTGGVSDTTTLILAPICGVAGINMLKLSGGGLGFTGGTIDKLMAFEGFNTEISMEKAKELVKKNNSCVISASLNLAPADKKIYALRNITATTESIPLIASSIMSKKLASGADAIVLDVKYGDGAFMKTKEDALSLAQLMVDIGKHFGKKMDYSLGDMNEPLGYNIGNKLESYEAIEVLSGKKGKLYDSSIELASKCIALGLDITYKEAEKITKESITSGKALQKFKDMISAQGGSLELFNGLGLTPTLIVKSEKRGTLTKINCSRLGELSGILGANKQKITDKIDYNVGLKTFHKLGEKINAGDTIFEIYAKNKQSAKDIISELIKCYEINKL